VVGAASSRQLAEKITLKQTGSHSVGQTSPSIASNLAKTRPVINFVPLPHRLSTVWLTSGCAERLMRKNHRKWRVFDTATDRRCAICAGRVPIFTIIACREHVTGRRQLSRASAPYRRDDEARIVLPSEAVGWLTSCPISDVWPEVQLAYIERRIDVDKHVTDGRASDLILPRDHGQILPNRTIATKVSYENGLYSLTAGQARPGQGRDRARVGQGTGQG